jgi:hypothetical protein
VAESLVTLLSVIIQQGECAPNALSDLAMEMSKQRIDMDEKIGNTPQQKGARSFWC